MSDSELPFILIASLRRTGSTVLSEALSQLPHCFIFQEPYLAMGHFFFSEYDATIFKNNDVDLFALREIISKNGKRNYIQGFAKHCMPVMQRVVQQLGAKEIRLYNWDLYVEYFPNLKVLITGRDPRDIYISLYNRYRNGVADWTGPFNPKTVSQDLMREFHRQLELYENCDSMLIRYEDLCVNNKLIDEVRLFTGCRIPVSGEIGSSLSQSDARSIEHKIHGNKITTKSVGRWKGEENINLREDAMKTFELMAGYNEFWRYE